MLSYVQQVYLESSCKHSSQKAGHAVVHSVLKWLNYVNGEVGSVFTHTAL